MRYDRNLGWIRVLPVLQHPERVVLASAPEMADVEVGIVQKARVLAGRYGALTLSLHYLSFQRFS